MGEAQIRAKQILNGDVILPDGTVAFTGNQSMGNQKLTNLGAPTAASDAARLQDIYNLNRKEKCKTVALTNITLSGSPQTINGQTCSDGERVLCINQTSHADDGIYVVGPAAWSRSADADSGAELTGAVTFIDLGTSGANTNYQQVNTITNVGVDVQDWVDIGGAFAGEPTSANKDMAASVTTADGNAATATALTYTPNRGSFIQVAVNGILVNLGNGVKTKACYFSGDGGTTARAWSAIVAGDTLRWNGTIALYQLAVTDRIDFYYSV